MEIQNIKLNDKHIGALVKYIPRHANGDKNHPSCEIGYIKSWGSKYVFVVYKNSCMSTNPNDLIFEENENAS